MVVGEHPPGDPVEPQPGLVAGRHLMTTTPGDEKGLGNDVGRIRRLLDAADGVRQDRLEVAGVEAAEAFLVLRSGAHLHPMSDREPIVTPRSEIFRGGTPW